MKRVVFLLITGSFISFSLQRCDKEDPIQSILTGKLTSHSDCKSGRKSAETTKGIPDTLSCVNYSYDSLSNKLTLKHINAGFNCCPEKLYCEVTASKDTIIISEFETSSLCDCDCLYDLEFVLSGVDEKSYYIRFVEPYCGDQEKLIFDADLSENKTGSFCVKRNRYPWGL